LQQFRTQNFDKYLLPLKIKTIKLIIEMHKMKRILIHFNVLLIITTDAIVSQKKAPGMSDVSTMASTIVKINNITSTTIDQTILDFKLPLKTKRTIRKCINF
jgi:hypothetical protein